MGMASNVKIGVAGWSYVDWEGVVYPRISSAEKLKLVAGHVDVIEINNTFYRMPDAKITAGWAHAVREIKDFTFTVKLNQDFTHKGEAEAEAARIFSDGILPLKDEGILGGLLIQFPFGFRQTDKNKKHIEKIVRFFNDFNLFVELRHRSWETAEEFFAPHNVTLVWVDMPLDDNSLGPLKSIRSGNAYIRMHGRNSDDWFRKDATRDEKYNYLYSKEELEQWVQEIKELGEQTKSVTVVMNNHYKGKAMANALKLKAAISGGKVTIPEPMFNLYPDLENIAHKPPRQGSLF